MTSMREYDASEGNVVVDSTKNPMVVQVRIKQ